jgi:hypothetical protein
MIISPIITRVSNIKEYKISLRKILNLKAEVLYKMHFGIFLPEERIEQFIRGYIE